MPSGNLPSTQTTFWFGRNIGSHHSTRDGSRSTRDTPDAACKAQRCRNGAAMSQRDELISRIGAEARLLDSTRTNVAALLNSGTSEFYGTVVAELIDAGAWDELNDRFYKTLAFGTGGLRGRAIGKVVTRGERGSAPETEPPEFPCVGTNAMNFYNISRATQGLVAYLRDWFARERLPGKPKLVIAHDTRFFSREFAALTAKVAAENGCDACVFDGPRSTPELSFAGRYLGASAGIVITASPNPPHDNGYKVYFDEGAQVVEPQASGIIAKVNNIKSEISPARPE